MFDSNRILGQFLGSSAFGGFAGGLAGGLLASRGGSKLGRRLLPLGAVAAIGALAYNAWRQHSSQKLPDSHDLPRGDTTLLVPETGAGPTDASALPHVSAGFLPPPDDQQAHQELGLLLIRAMIAAGRADGKIDGDEMERILSRADERTLSAGDKARVLDELRNPVDLPLLVAQANTPQRALEMYTAALLAVDIDTQAERAWFDDFAKRLKLERALTERVEREVAARS